MISNSMRFDAQIFDSSCVVRESILKQVVFNPNLPGLMTGILKEFQI